MQSQIKVNGPDVHRSVSASWKVTQHWGSRPQDVREFLITRRGENVTIMGPGVSSQVTLKLEVARMFAGALLAAAKWEDDDDLHKTAIDR